MLLCPLMGQLVAMRGLREVLLELQAVLQDQRLSVTPGELPGRLLPLLLVAVQGLQVVLPGLR